MQMSAELKPISTSKKTIGIEYQLRLKKGHVNKIIGLVRLLAGIEKQLFKGLDWLKVSEPQEGLLEILSQLIQIAAKNCDRIYPERNYAANA
jgi:hypothetical protein